MGTELITRTLMAFAIAGIGVGFYWIANRILLARASQKHRGLENFQLGIPAILYFTTPSCVPCKTTQRPAIQKVQELLGGGIQILEVDASIQTEVADHWGVLSVPTTYIIDKHGKLRQINHGVTLADKLLTQINRINKEKNYEDRT